MVVTMVGEDLAVLCYQLPGIRSDVVSVSVSGQCLVTGHRSGDVTLYSLRVRGAGGLQLTQTASRRVTEARDKLSVVSVVHNRPREGCNGVCLLLLPLHQH